MSSNLQHSLRLSSIHRQLLLASVLLSVCSQAHIGPTLQPKTQEDAATRAHRPLSLFRTIRPRTNNICQIDNKPDGSLDFLVNSDDKSTKQQFQ